MSEITQSFFRDSAEARHSFFSVGIRNERKENIDRRYLSSRSLTPFIHSLTLFQLL